MFWWQFLRTDLFIFYSIIIFSSSTQINWLVSKHAQKLTFCKCIRFDKKIFYRSWAWPWKKIFKFSKRPSDIALLACMKLGVKSSLSAMVYMHDIQHKWNSSPLRPMVEQEINFKKNYSQDVQKRNSKP